MHGRSAESAVGCRLSVVGCEVKGQRKLFRPFMTAIFSGDLFCLRMKCFWV